MHIVMCFGFSHIVQMRIAAEVEGGGGEEEEGEGGAVVSQWNRKWFFLYFLWFVTYLCFGCANQEFCFSGALLNASAANKATRQHMLRLSAAEKKELAARKRSAELQRVLLPDAPPRKRQLL